MLRVPGTRSTNPPNQPEPTTRGEPPWRLNGPQREGMPRQGSLVTPSNIAPHCPEQHPMLRAPGTRSKTPPNRPEPTARGEPPWRLNGPQREGMPRQGSFVTSGNTPPN